MTDRNEMNENNELNEQELEQATGGVGFSDLKPGSRAKGGSDGPADVLYRCPKCGATKKVAAKMALRALVPICENCHARMVEA